MDNMIIALVAVIILTWGLQGFLYKVATEKIGLHASWFWVFFVSAVAYTVLTIATYFRGYATAPQMTTGLIGIGVAAGVTGYILYIMLIQQTKVSIAIPLTALYPAVTILLGILVLNEKLKLTEAVGIGLALLAGILLSL